MVKEFDGPQYWLQPLAEADGIVFLIASDADHGDELWLADLPGQTHLTLDINGYFK